ncbi:MAG: SBBP repeat-containing protein [Bacteroidia bacterium]
MRTLLLVSIAAICCTQTTLAQSSSWTWAKVLGGSAADVGNDSAMDNLGNVYVTGSFAGSLIAGPDTMQANGNDDIFLIKYDPQGNVVWARRAGSAGYDDSKGVAVDSLGNIYIAGIYGSGSMQLDTITISSPGNPNIFLAKYSPDGKLRWALSPPGGGTNRCNDVAVDGKGNAFITGNYTNSLAFGGIPCRWPMATGHCFLPNLTAWGRRFGREAQMEPPSTGVLAGSRYRRQWCTWLAITQVYL